MRAQSRPTLQPVDYSPPEGPSNQTHFTVRSLLSPSPEQTPSTWTKEGMEDVQQAQQRGGMTIKQNTSTKSILR